VPTFRAPQINLYSCDLARAAALFLSAVGLNGILSYFVAQKTREIGIQITLGAQARNVRRLVVKQGLRIARVGAI
jgi:putative ABC transport system permease protein